MLNARLALRQFIVRWLPVTAWMLIIFWFSAQPKHTVIPDFGILDFGIKKTAHVIEYALLATLWLRALKGQSPLRGRQIVTAFVLSVLYAASDEYHQTFVAGREGRWEDVAVDALGAMIALTLLRYWTPASRLLIPNKSE